MQTSVVPRSEPAPPLLMDISSVSDEDVNNAKSEINQIRRTYFNCIIFPCGHFRQLNRRVTLGETEVCPETHCNSEIKGTVIVPTMQEEINVVKKFINNLEERLQARNFSKFDVSKLRKFVAQRIQCYTLKCGHCISFKNLKGIVSGLQNAEIAIGPVQLNFICYLCRDEKRTDNSGKDFIALPNRLFRRLAAIVNRFLPAPNLSSHPLHSTLPAQLSGALIKPAALSSGAPRPIQILPRASAEEILSKVDHLNYCNPHAKDVATIKVWISCHKDSGEAWIVTTRFLTEVLNSENVNLMRDVIAHLSKVGFNDGKRRIFSDLMIGQLRVLIGNIAPYNDKVPVTVGLAISLLRLARDYAYTAFDTEKYEQIAAEIIKTPYLIVRLDGETIRDIDALIQDYPVLIDRLCGATEDQNQRMANFQYQYTAARAFSHKNVGVTTDSAITTLSELIGRWNLNDENAAPVKFITWLLDNAGSEFILRLPERLRYNVCIRLLKVSDIPTILDLKLLDHLPLFLDVFDRPHQEDFNYHQLFKPWMMRCLAVAHTPDEIPQRFAALQNLVGFVKYLSPTLEQTEVFKLEQRLIQYEWINFLSRSRLNRNIEQAIKLLFEVLSHGGNKDVRYITTLIPDLLSSANGKVKLNSQQVKAFIEPVMPAKDAKVHPYLNEYYRIISLCLDIYDKTKAAELRPFFRSIYRWIQTNDELNQGQTIIAKLNSVYPDMAQGV